LTAAPNFSAAMVFFSVKTYLLQINVKPYFEIHQANNMHVLNVIIQIIFSLLCCSGATPNDKDTCEM